MSLAEDLHVNQGMAQPERCGGAVPSELASGIVSKERLKESKARFVPWAIGLLLFGLLASHVHSTVAQITAPVAFVGSIEVTNR